MFLYRFKLIQSLMMTGLAVLTSACGMNTGEVVKECVLPNDQLGTLSAKWRTTAVPIAFHQGDFSTAEIQEIVAAADTWNTFFAASKGMSAIDYGSAASPRMSNVTRPSSGYLCSSGIVQGATYTGTVVIYKDGTWPYTSQPNAMALTNFCRTPAKPLPYFYMAMIELNYQNFFVVGKRVPDLQTIILHEFGHLMGLNHSCESTARTGVPGCTAKGTPSAYLDAVMFPSFGFDNSGYGQEKRDLMENDQGRANCLYE